MKRRSLADHVDDIKFGKDGKMSFIGKIITIFGWIVVGMFVLAAFGR